MPSSHCEVRRLLMMEMCTYIETKLNLVTYNDFSQTDGRTSWNISNGRNIFK